MQVRTQRRLEGSWHHVRMDQFSLEFLLSQCYFCLVSSINVSIVVCVTKQLAGDRERLF